MVNWSEAEDIRYSLPLFIVDILGFFILLTKYVTRPVLLFISKTMHH